MAPVKKTKGRQKIDLVKIQDEQSLQVTFSKRRAGLFKKACELCTLTGSQVGLVVFSPGEKAYTFGSPSIDFVIEMFESKSPKPVDTSTLLLEAHHKLGVRHLNNELTILENELEAKKKIGENLDQLRKVGQICHWWEAPINDLNLEQLENLQAALVELQKTVKSELKKPMYENANQNPNLKGINPYGIGLFGIDAKENVHGVLDLLQSKPPRTMTFPPIVVTSKPNTGISIRDRPVASTAENRPTTSPTFNPNASDFGGSIVTPHPSRGFKNSYGGFPMFKI